MHDVPATGALIDAAGEVRLGIFSAPIELVDERAYRLTDPFDRPITGLRKRFASKRFEFVGLVSPALIVGCAIVDLRYVGSSFVYLFEPPTRRFRSYSLRAPLALGTRFRRTPERGRSSFRAGGRRLSITADPDARTRALAVSLPGVLEIDALIDEASPALTPMCICTRTGATGWTYTRKAAGAPARGVVRWEGRDYELEALGACGSSDYSAGYMRRETSWLWGCFSGQLADGRRVGFNAACGVNETSFNENCFWVDGRRHDLHGVHFDFDRAALSEPWRLRTQDGRVDLEFTPEGEHRERLNAWLLASNFTQLLGRFHGRLRDEAGEVVAIDGVHGFVERQFARW
ncbi:MAG: DUF2804 domain-containing protein [Nannocystaceae bacterium]|nr:DUF2804 domain-containing protein [Myxococcales bacterium]